jgi:hypothetical protein
MKKVEMTVYITTDDKKFFTESEARRHEETIAKTKAYKVHYGPDLTETGMRLKEGYIVVQADWSHELWVEDWLYKKFGNRIAFVQGVAPTENWTFHKVDMNEVDHSKILATIRK